MLNSVDKRTPPCGMPVLIDVVQGLRPLMLFALILMIVPGMFVGSSFLISVCMFTVSKVLLISSVTVMFAQGGAILVEPLCYGVINVCSAVTAECFVPVLHGCVCSYVGKKAFLQCLCNY